MSGPGAVPEGPPRSVRISGWGSYVPERVLTNADLERIVDTSDEWIRTRTGISERRVAAPHETTATLGAIAAKRAIAVAGLEPDDIDVIVVATLTPDYPMPSTAALVKEAIGNRTAAAFDIGAACSGFVFGYATADSYVRSGMARHVLVVGAELLTRFLDFEDRGTCILFGDGAGAVVLSASDEPGGGMCGLEMTTDPDGAYMIWLPSGGSRSPSSPETTKRGEHFIRMEGRETYRYATRTLAASALAAIEKAGWTADEVDLFIPHQANVRIIEAVAKGLKLPMDTLLREHRQVRQHLRGLGGHRPRRGRGPGPRQARRQDRLRGLRCRLHLGCPRHRVDGRPGRCRTCGARWSRWPACGPRSTGPPSTPSRRAWPRCSTIPRGPRSRSTTSCPASPSTRTPRSSYHDRSLRQDRRRHRRRAWHRPCHRSALRGPGCGRLLQLPRQRRGRAGHRAEEIEAMGRTALAVQADVAAQDSAKELVDAAHRRAGARSTSSSTTPASRVTTSSCA